MAGEGKEPVTPSLKEKIMFWKTYRKYIKGEINRMRQVVVSAMKSMFIKGE